ncbi:phosphoadenylyl-sulfate reductase [Kaustia mangrovi]|uniref:Adenosine 5'-phosphosulfate reductase n=1 Tax=Kaustia mangrovi TaxID=2593653 RepID=A0A7S8C7V4_9HYPH|nr:phosphoadenylyl-sulfate reductase [Kaustia mangrovi]QPC45009.1 phosphoadenylyl-sulfate reductase [Kaustia mangrovi]
MIRYDLVIRRYGELSGAALLAPLIQEVFPGRIALVSSFGAESAVLLHMISEIDRATPVVFLDTGKLFPETLLYRDRLIARLGLTDVRSIGPEAHETPALDPDGTLWQSAPDACCHFRKVVPLERALRGFTAWITGRKRMHGGERAVLPMLETADWRLKANPLADWSAEDIAGYMEHHGLPGHPLTAVGYRSIGCMPCTRPVTDNEDARAGRWSGLDKSECGIHWTANGRPIRVAQ